MLGNLAASAGAITGDSMMRETCKFSIGGRELDDVGGFESLGGFFTSYFSEGFLQGGGIE